MYALGISCFYHDAAACLLRDGEVVAAAQEERFTRRKHDPRFPVNALRYVLAAGGIRPADVDVVAVHDKPLAKFDRMIETVLATAPAGRTRFVDALPSWFSERLRHVELLDEHLGYAGEVLYVPHHESHAASAFHASPFSEAAVLTADGVGDWETGTLGRGEGARVELLVHTRFPHSLGLLYSAFTQYLGFRVNNGEYKVMGLAPYGQPRFADRIRDELIDLKPDGSFRLNLEHFAFLTEASTIGPSFAGLFGAPIRAPESPLGQNHKDVARSIQAVTEEVLERQAREAQRRTGSRFLCMAGGVALNSVANGRILRSGMFEDLFVQPAASDAGGALGAALVATHHVRGLSRPRREGDAMKGAMLGPSFEADRMRAALQEAGLPPEAPEDLLERTAELLDQGAVVGWFQGRMEYGPRALGSRSILADPRPEHMRTEVNKRVKFREGFRPFAPIVREAAASDWFELDGASPYMLLVVPVVEARRGAIPAVTHVDGSARVQTVPEGHPFAPILAAFEARTGCPVLLNTSFNLRGEPIVCTPEDAVASFLASGLDALVMGPFLVRRPDGVTPTGRPPPPPAEARREPSARELRTFGLGLAALGLLAGWLVGGLVWVGPAVAGLVLVSLAAPGWLHPLEAAARRVGEPVGAFQVRLLLHLIHLLVVTPIGLIRRRADDPLQRQLDPTADSYWVPVPPGSGYERMS